MDVHCAVVVEGRADSKPRAISGYRHVPAELIAGAATGPAAAATLDQCESRKKNESM
jgi:hypothetical protein